MKVLFNVFKDDSVVFFIYSIDLRNICVFAFLDLSFVIWSFSLNFRGFCFVDVVGVYSEVSFLEI